MSKQVARLGKEVIGYLLGPSEDNVGNAKAANSGSYAALVALNNPNASAPIGTLRGIVVSPSARSWTTVATHEGSSSLMLYADRQRPVIHLHVYQSPLSSRGTSSSSSTCPLTARLHPPEPTPTLAISPDSTILAAGSSSGRLYIWHLSSGHLLASFDAHFRAVTCLRWTADGRALVSGSEDARIMVWSRESLLDSPDSIESASLSTVGNGNASLDSSSTRPTPFAILADHVEGITGIELSSSSRSSISSFPSSLRIFSASKDGTVKLWDIRTRSLVATWTFNGPVKHLVCDIGFRSFFVVVRGRGINRNKKAGKTDEEEIEEEDEQEHDWVRRIDLFGGNAPETTSKGSGNTASLFRIEDAPQSFVYKASPGVLLTALALSINGSHLLVGTSDTQLISIDVASSVVIRTTPLIAAGQTGLTKSGSGGTATSNTCVLSLSTFLIEDAFSLLQGASMRSKGGSMGRSGDGAGWSISETLGRTKLPSKYEKNISTNHNFSLQLHNFDVSETLTEITPPSLRSLGLNGDSEMLQRGGIQGEGSLSSTKEQLRKANDKIAELENEKAKLNDLLKRAQKTNAGLWERVVQDQLPKKSDV